MACIEQGSQAMARVSKIEAVALLAFPTILRKVSCSIHAGTAGCDLANDYLFQVGEVKYLPRKVYRITAKRRGPSDILAVLQRISKNTREQWQILYVECMGVVCCMLGCVIHRRL